MNVIQVSSDSTGITFQFATNSEEIFIEKWCNIVIDKWGASSRTEDHMIIGPYE